jgi:streptomycin 6-kinase
MSVVIRCRTSDGRPAVLKVSPDRERLAHEAAALDSWATIHTPSVLAVDEAVGALLLEEIQPGTTLVDSQAYPQLESVAELLTSLHATGVAEPSHPPLAHRVEEAVDLLLWQAEDVDTIAERAEQWLRRSTWTLAASSTGAPRSRQ